MSLPLAHVATGSWQYSNVGGIRDAARQAHRCHGGDDNQYRECRSGVPFESTKQALTYVQSGRAKGKVVVKVR
jgi:hypothetical protein